MSTNGPQQCAYYGTVALYTGLYDLTLSDTVTAFVQSRDREHSDVKVECERCISDVMLLMHKCIDIETEIPMYIRAYICMQKCLRGLLHRLLIRNT